MYTHFTEKQKQQKTKFSAAFVVTRGFTLVEILMVVTLVGIVTALLMQGFSRYAYRQSFKQFVSEVQDETVEARAQTVASLNNTTYGVYVGTDTVEFFSGATPVVGDAANTIIPIPTEVTATASFSSGNQYITFKRLTGEATATGTIEFVDTRTVATSTITISAAGLVE